MSDIIYGSGDYGASAIVSFKIKGRHGISENKVSYWISHLLFDARMIIFKNSTQGQKLTKMINDNIALDLIMEYLNGLVLRKIKVATIISSIDNIKQSSYNEGRVSLQTDLKKLLYY